LSVDLKAATPDTSLPASGFLFGADSQVAASPSVYSVSTVAAALVGGSNGQLQYNNSGAFGGFTLGGDGTINTGTGALTVSKIGGVSVSLAGSLTTSGANALTLTTTGATNVTLPTSGTLAVLGANTFTGDQTVSSAALILSGNISSASWDTTGLALKAGGRTLTDTSGAGTVAAAATNHFGGNTIAASNARTFTNYYSVYLGDPTAGANVTFTNKWALGLAGALSGTSATFTGSVRADTGFNVQNDTFLNRSAAATWQLGAADASSAVAQTLKVQSVVAGTTNTAGANFTIQGSAGTGTGAGGSIIFQVAPAGSTGSAQNAFVDALTISSDKIATFPGAVYANAQLRLLNNASLVFYGTSGGADQKYWDCYTANDASNSLYFRALNDAFSASYSWLTVSRSGYQPQSILFATGTGTTCLTLKSGAAVLANYTVANLPAAATAGSGAVAFVTDANSTTARTTVAGGGANKVMVMSDGTNWLIVA
jgi:hypothetical protein